MVNPLNPDIIEEVKQVLSIDYSLEDARIDTLASSAIENFEMMGIPLLQKNEKKFHAYCNLIARNVLPTLSENYAQSQFFQTTYYQDLTRMILHFENNQKVVVTPHD